MWEGFCNIAQSAWWGRVWTLQEAVLAPEASLHYGVWRIPWKEIADADANSSSHEGRCCVGARNAILGDVYGKIYKLLDAVGNISFARRPRPQGASRPNFRNTQVVFRGRDCKEPRDRIYGMLGLFDYGEKLKLVPDYSLNLSDVYTRAFRSMIEEFDGDLQPLLGFGFNSDRNGLPSWVPDFTLSMDAQLQRREHFRFAFQYPQYDACKGMKATMAFEDDKWFRLRGVQVGVVQASSMPQRMDSWPEVSKVTRELAQLANVPTTHSDTSSKFSKPYEMFWRTVIADIYYENEGNDYKRISEDHFLVYEQLRTRAINDTKLSMRHPKFDFAGVICSVLDDRSFFITKEGLFGVGPTNLQPEDEIWVLYGGRVPFVLRKTTNNALQNQNSYKFIGDCYYHGVMDGQALNNSAPESTVILI